MAVKGEGQGLSAQPESAEKPQSPDAAPEARPNADRSIPAPAPRGAPGWVLVVYLAGMLAVFVGERVLATFETTRWVVSLLGVGAIVVATVLRFAVGTDPGTDRGKIERLLGLCSVGGAVALALYFVTIEPVAGWLGLSGAEVEPNDRRDAVLTVVWLTLLTSSLLPMLFAEAAMHPMRKAVRPEGRRVMAAAVSGLVLALAAVYCSLFVFAAESVDVKADYSYFKTSEPGPSTMRIAKSLKEPVTVYAFFPQVNEVKTEVAGYLKALAAAAPKLKVQFHDRLLAPRLARSMRANRDGTVILSRGGTTESMTLGTELDRVRPNLRKLDQTFQKHLLKVARKPRIAYLTVGHGELNDPEPGQKQPPTRSVVILRKLLDSQNYRVKDLGLAQGLGAEIPSDATLVMVLGPTRPFAAEELAALKRYVEATGRLLLALD